MGKTKQKQDRSHYLFSNRELANLIGPLVIEQLLAVFVGMADSIMVANVGEAAVSGVSLVDNIMILIINIFAALATGGAVVAGQYIGRKDEKSACKAATQLVWFVSLSAVAIMILVYLGKDIILNQVFGHITAEVKGHADIYLLIVTASIPFIALYNGGAAIFPCDGEFAGIYAGIAFDECNQCNRKCNSCVRITDRNGGCCNTDTDFQNGCRDSDNSVALQSDTYLAY